MRASRAGANGTAGFTLIELMIVVVIIGILAAIAIPKFGAVTKQSKIAESTPFLKQIITLEERFFHSNDRFTGDLAELEGGTNNFTGAKYYTFSVTTDGSTTVCANATPNAAGLAAGLTPRSMNRNGTIFEAAGC
jgi:prepilin-type N-terminal cleavage/methylation domain-containing protein